ncbi:MAG TPA: HD domain-containing protein [Deltaproteobacteria bacterium]|nr:HD domain-containing protein [Deltaproteobacteria bacterium]
MNPIVEDIRRLAYGLFKNASLSHDWDHTQRVYRLCMHIGQVEGADCEVLSVAALLHDIGRISQDVSRGAVCHAEEGARMAREILSPFDLPAEKKDNVIHCVLTHRFRNSHVPETLEARCLFDADKLDAIGAVGIARAYLFAGEVGAVLHNPEASPEETLPYTRDDTGYREYMVKLRKIKDRMLTSEGRRMAQDRHAFMEAFFERFLKEYEGDV